ncbi:methyltransferase [Candidatus Woesearchaeota archaeon]|nr:methyltransferase [Candidatus Woesearchaeota archaeon]
MVYEPAEDTELMAGCVRSVVRGRVLDMGSGNGEQTAAALSNAATTSVVAADIDPDAIAHLRTRFRDEKRVRVIHSDLLYNVKRRFDTIIFNPPYLPQDKGITDIQIYGGKHGYERIIHFLDQAGNHLAPEGQILLLWSSLSKPRVILDHLEKRLYTYEKIAETHISFEDLFVYRITKNKVRERIEKQGIRSLMPFDRGKRGWILTGMKGKTKIAIKVANPTSEASGRLLLEAQWMKRLNRHGIGPRFIASDPDFVIYAFVDGTFVLDYLSEASRKETLVVVEQLLDQCRMLDTVGVSKEEMHHPVKHVLVSDARGVRVTLIDFERTHPDPHPKNVTQVCQFVNGMLRAHLLKVGLEIDSATLLNLAKQYRHRFDETSFRAIKDYILKRGAKPLS